MTLLLLGLGAGLAALGTRAAALAFAGAAVVAATGDSLQPFGVWTAAMALGLVGLRGSPRRLALPVLGAAAALGVGSARNTAVVGALWVIGTISAVVSAGRSPGARRWAATVCAADLPFLAAVLWTAVRIGFEGWPLELDGVALALLLAAVVVRTPLAAGPDEAPEAGLLPIRGQTVVLLGVVLGNASPGRSTLVAVALIAAAGFAAGGLFRRAGSRDVVQEVSLVGLVLGLAALGWGPMGWEWGALGAGTLIHNLRLRLGVAPWAALAAALLRGGGIMLPFLPIILVALEGSIRGDDVARIGIPVALLGGLVARTAHEDPAVPPERATRRWELASTAAVVSAAAVAGVWAPLFTVPSDAAAVPVGWPPMWAMGGTLVLAGLAAAVGRVRAPAGAPSGQVLTLPDPLLPPRWAGERPLAVGQVGLAAVAIAVWVLGGLRGFL